MSFELDPGYFPSYETFTAALAPIHLPLSCSELHGVVCGYICAGAFEDGEMYLRALTIKMKKNDETQEAARALFALFAISKQQISTLDFEFQLLLPPDEAPLFDRARAFGEWCEGFTQGITLAGIGVAQLEEEESQDILHHLVEFAQLDYQELEIDEDSEKALMEVSEYTRMAVLRLSEDIQANNSGKHSSGTVH